jgi:hypothetical protein
LDLDIRSFNDLGPTIILGCKILLEFLRGRSPGYSSYGEKLVDNFLVANDLYQGFI